MYNQELRTTGLELTQFTLLMALNITGEITQGGVGKLLALDTTTLTRMLRLLTTRGWIEEKAGDDRRQRLLSDHRTCTWELHHYGGGIEL